MKLKNISVTFVIALAGLFYTQHGIAQVSVTNNASAPDPSAMLDVQSTTRGILVPRMTALQRGTIASPAPGLIVYQTDAPAGPYYQNGTAWKHMVELPASASFPSGNTLITSDGTNWVSKSIIIGSTGGNAGFNNMQPYLTMNYCISLWGVYPVQSGSNPYVGELNLFGFGFVPYGWAACNGQLLSIAENEVLFNLIGTTFGGNGMTTFAVPDLRGRVAIHQGVSYTGSYIIGQSGGYEAVTLSPLQIPTHTHTVTFQ